MKKIFASLIVLFVINAAHAQLQDPVKWNYLAKKKNDKEYVVTIDASLASAWHIYSINTPPDGPVPTSISFKKNPLVIVDGAVKEDGELKTDHDAIFGVDVKYYSDKVEFTQTVKLKSAVKTNLSGTVKYMVCNDKMCLPPKTVPFDVQLQ